MSSALGRHSLPVWPIDPAKPSLPHSDGRGLDASGIHCVGLFIKEEVLSGIFVCCTLGHNIIVENAVSAKEQYLQDVFLNTLRKEHVPVSIFLVNGIKLVGHIESFDLYVVRIRSTTVQLAFKHAISTVVPMRDVKGAWSD